MSASFIPGPAERVPEPRPAVDYHAVRKVHLIGIGGSAMGNFAGMLQAKGLEVRGSDAGVFDPMRTQLQQWQTFGLDQRPLGARLLRTRSGDAEVTVVVQGRLDQLLQLRVLEETAPVHLVCIGQALRR